MTTIGKDLNFTYKTSSSSKIQKKDTTSNNHKANYTADKKSIEEDDTRKYSIGCTKPHGMINDRRL